ncbi:MAG: hypothetical protein KDK99_11535 [Verrucomicrobiales bacterium]|nr:hypothetical protein [Verrucomicrobiales bacterium]
MHSFKRSCSSIDRWVFLTLTLLLTSTQAQTERRVITFDDARSVPGSPTKIDFPDATDPKPQPTKTNPISTSPPPQTPSAAPIYPERLPLGFAASFVGEGPLKNLPFVWSPQDRGWRSATPYVLPLQDAEATQLSDEDLQALTTSLRRSGMILAEFQLRSDEQGYLVIGLPRVAAGVTSNDPGSNTVRRDDRPPDTRDVIIFRAGWVGQRAVWNSKAKGWRSVDALNTPFDGKGELDANIRAWIKGSDFPKGSSFHLDPAGHVVVTPP